MKLTGRSRALVLFVTAAVFLAVIAVCGAVLRDAAMVTDFTRRSLSPSPRHPFGTDWMGRDMFVRTLTGLSMSIRIGLLTASISACVALAMGAAAAMLGRAADAAVTWLIDLVMGVPHLLLLMLIAFACGRGFSGILVGITVTHWMSLARVMRGEILQLRGSGYVLVAHKLGADRLIIVRRHMLPHLLPQFLTGLILLFPHAILHEASITFLGFGLSPEQPAIGVILSESMRYLSTGQWWLAVFPGLLLVATVLLFQMAGSSLRTLTDPASIHQ